MYTYKHVIGLLTHKSSVDQMQFGYKREEKSEGNFFRTLEEVSVQIGY